MSFSGFASSASQENVCVQVRVEGPRGKAAPRVVLAVLPENDQRRNGNLDIPLKPVTALHRVSTRGQEVLFHPPSAGAVRVAEPEELLVVKPAEMATCDLHPSAFEMFTAVNDFTSECGLDASMQSLSEEDPVRSEEILCAAEYAEELHKHLRESELRYSPTASYMRKQPDVTDCMRVILVDWLVEVSEEYQLCSETLYLAVNYLDRFLSCMSVLRGKLQLVGTAAILLAAKYEEIYPPEVDEFVYITDDTYSKKQLLRMEQLMLKVLSFDMTAPTAHQFVMQYILMEVVCVKTTHLALYVSELSLLEVDPFLQYLPSLVAAAAYCLANYTVNQVLWPESLYRFTGYTLAAIAPCLIRLHQLHLAADSRPQQAIYEKYRSPKYCAVSLVRPMKALPLS